MTPDQINQYRKAIAAALASNPDIARYAGTNTPDALLDAYTTGDWSGLISITGKPFTNAQQKQAVAQAEKDLAPAYRAQESFDRDEVKQALANEQGGLTSFLKNDAEAFRADKTAADQDAADQGVLFSGSRFQKENDIRNLYNDRANITRAGAADRMRTTARAYQYKYGDQAAGRLSGMYGLAGTPGYNTSVGGGGRVTPNRTLSAAYDPKAYNFQGTAPVSQSAAVQTRAAGLLTNRANKLTASGYKNKL